MENAILSIRDLRVVFEDGFVALGGVSLDIGKNEFVTLLGPSGCGKTTLLRCIGGFEKPSAGEILYKGENIVPLPPYKRAINTVFQRYALFPHLNVAQNVAFGPELRGEDKKKTAAEVTRMLELVGLSGFERRKIASLSGGQQQRVAIARALINQPDVLLLDEPLAALDLKLRREMQLELKRIQRESGITFIFVTHDQEEALTMSDRVAVMRAGEILQLGTPEDIYNEPQSAFVADFIGDSNILAGTMVRDRLVRFLGCARIRSAHKRGDFSSDILCTLSVIQDSGGTPSDRIHGKPAACASIIVTGRPSYREGNTNTSIACIRAGTSLRTPVKITFPLMPKVLTLFSISGRKLPSPTRSNTAFSSLF